MALVLGIESSCDETAAAVVQDGHLVLSSQVATQIEVHRKYGGVVPELASRNHVVDIVPVVRDAMAEAGLGFPDLDAIAVTQGPGLVGALLVGLQAAKALAYAHDKPLVPVHHLEGHLHGVFLHRAGEERPVGPAFPHVALCVSGGHTAVYHVGPPITRGPELRGGLLGGREPGGPPITRVKMLANTRDDAAGEAFDKVARMLGLGYPGGPIIEHLAWGGNPRAHRFSLPRFKDDSPLDFSFSGLKTAVLTVIQNLGGLPEGLALADLLASFQQSAVDQLVDRVRQAAARADVVDVQLAGGVACNTSLREALARVLASDGRRLHVPPPRYCTDNAAMIAGAGDAGAERVRGQGHRAADRSLNARPTWALADAAGVLRP